MTKKFSFGFSPRETTFYNNRLHRMTDFVFELAAAITGDDPAAAALALSRVYEFGDTLKELREILVNEVFAAIGEMFDGNGDEPEQADQSDEK